jgi:hypothetical protein
MSAARQIADRVPLKGRLPAPLGLFPREGLVANSEKFILQNVLGFGFLHHGYLADYRAQEQEFELFIIQGSNPQDARDMLDMYLESQRQAGQATQATSLGYHIKDRYAQNIYLSLSGNMILGVMRIKDGFEDLGQKYLSALVISAKK